MKKLRHILAFVLALSMVFCMMPSVFAGGIRVESEHGIPVTQEGGDGIAVKSELSSVWDKFKDTVSDVVDYIKGDKPDTMDEAIEVGNTDTQEDKKDDYTMNILHLDCGRKYFSVKNIKAIIKNAANNNFNYVQLALGNDGLRFLLDDKDMNITFTVNGTEYSYDGSAVNKGINEGNKAYNARQTGVTNGDGGHISYVNQETNELTKSEMDDIIAYAKKLGVGIIPLINTPGHMDAILYAAEALTGSTLSYAQDDTNSNTTIDVTNEIATEFTKAVLQNYIDYFKDKGCKYFNMGADEYANDITGNPLFGTLNSGMWDKLNGYINDVAAMIKKAGMTPIAFNDAICYNSNENSGTVSKDVMVMYWSSGWGGYNVAAANTLRSMGYSMINTNGDYYWVLGKNERADGLAKKYDNGKEVKFEYYDSTTFDEITFMGSTISDPVGSTFCIWCDYPGDMTDSEVVDKTASAIKTFGNNSNIPTVAKGEDVTWQEPVADTPDDSVGSTPDDGDRDNSASTEKTITVSVGGSDTITVAVTEEVTPTVASDIITVSGQTYARDPDTTEIKEVTSVTSGESYYIGDGNGNYLSVSGTSLENSSDKTTKWTVVKSGSDYCIYTTINGAKYYLRHSDDRLGLQYSYNNPNDSAYKWTCSGTVFGYTKKYVNNGDRYLTYSSGWTIGQSVVTETKLYKETSVQGAINSTTVTITGVEPGDTTVTIGDTTYTVHVNNVVEDINETITVNSTYTMDFNSFSGDVKYEIINGSENITRSNNAVTANAVGEATVQVTVTKNSKPIATYTYNFTITKEDLSKVTGLEIEYWITNARVPGNDDSSTNRRYVKAADAYDKDGVEISKLVPGEQDYESRKLEYWQTRMLDATTDEAQTRVGGDDETNSGKGITKVRYWESKWQAYDGENWYDVNTDKTSIRISNSDTTTEQVQKTQLVAYYLEVIDIANINGTSELHVNAADWGSKGDNANFGFALNEGICTVSVQLVYADGTMNPSKAEAESLNPKTIVYGYWGGGRGLGTMVFNGEGNFKITKVTAETGTLTCSSPSDKKNWTITNYSWDNNPVTVWNETEPADTVSIHANTSGFTDEDKANNLVWIDPNTYNTYENPAILIRVYVETVETADTLNVHYIDASNQNYEFYKYSISVKENTFFNTNIGLNEDKTAVVNGDVINYYGETRTVEPDLEKLPSVSAKYKYSKYTIENLVRSNDGKDVYIYYSFTNVHNFVIDFGQPIEITAGDIGITLDSSNNYYKSEINSNYKTFYGKAVLDDHVLTYTPEKILKGSDTVAIDIVDLDKDGKIVMIEEKYIDSNGNTQTREVESRTTHIIHLYPATNVLYEETVADLPKNGGWDKVEYDGSWQAENITAQATEQLGEESVHGYDDIYSENTGFSADSAYVATLTAGNAQTSTKGAVTFTFTGTGFDLISECGPDTGLLLANLYKGTGDDKVLKRIIMADTYFTGDDQYIKYSDTDEYGVLDYQVPVIRKLNLDYDTYTVEVYGYMIERENVATASYSMDSYDFTESIIAKVADEFGFDDDPSLYEIVFMDENSILNGGTGESPFDDYSVSVMSADTVDSYASTKTGKVYIDGIRVYETMENVEYATAENNTTYYSIVEEAKEGTTTFNEGSFVYVEGTGSQADLKDYQKTGPQNEIYLISGATLAFELNGYVATQTNKDSIQIAARAVNGSPTMFDNVVMEGNTSIELTTSTEMYYNVNVSESNGKSYLMITCNSSDEKTAILSISGIKLPHGVTINTSPSEEVKTAVYAKVCAIGSDEFVPSVFTVNVNSSVKSGKSIMITAQTSTDVDKIIVEYQDESYELTPNNKTMVECEMSSVYTYSKSFKTAKSAEKGDVELTFVACSSDDNSVTSEPITKTVTIK